MFLIILNFATKMHCKLLGFSIDVGTRGSFEGYSNLNRENRLEICCFYCSAIPRKFTIPFLAEKIQNIFSMIEILTRFKCLFLTELFVVKSRFLLLGNSVFLQKALRSLSLSLRFARNRQPPPTNHAASVGMHFEDPPQDFLD